MPIIPQPASVESFGAAVDGEPPVVARLRAGLPAEGYVLHVREREILLDASDDAGLHYGRQTLALLPRPLTTMRVEDAPRFAYRGAMLDVARHFFPVDAVLRYIDDIAALKINHLHLHLSDDQGWRIQIDSWPELTGIGASTQVGGGGGGFFSKDDYRRIVDHAASRFITVVPEIDLPGHTTAAISAYPELGDAPVSPYEGIEVGFSSVAIRNERTYEFIDDVVRELAEITPGRYLHLGGDESFATSDDDYLYFVARATAIAAAYGKTLIGWHEMGRSSELPPGMIGQFWSFTTPQEGTAEHAASFVEQGGSIIMSPADVAYLDIKYEEEDELGLLWAKGPTTLRAAYEWDPDDVVPGLLVSGVEAPLWTETLSTIEQVEQMAFPRLAAIAEIAWSPREGRSFADFVERLAEMGARWDTAGIHFTRVAGVSWRN